MYEHAPDHRQTRTSFNDEREACLTWSELIAAGFQV